jgi:myo-inositol 2-dehydrogenase / D-chiro-inositol 1-dehydrogenase
VRSFVPFEFETVFAHGSCLFSDEIRAFNDYDTVSVQLISPGGETCTILNSRRCSYGFEQRIEIFGSAGTIALENPRPTNIRWFTKEGERRGPLYEFFPQRYASSYERLLDDFVSKARSDEPFSVTIHDGLRSLALAEAARRSADNRVPISMSAIG